MKAGVVHAREDIRYEEIPTPSPKAGQVLIKVKYTGICGSDVPRVNGDACHFFPNVLGHEFSGVVEETGEGVTGVKPGDRVAGVPPVSYTHLDVYKRQLWLPPMPMWAELPPRRPWLSRKDGTAWLFPESW